MFIEYKTDTLAVSLNSHCHTVSLRHWRIYCYRDSIPAEGKIFRKKTEDDCGDAG